MVKESSYNHSYFSRFLGLLLLMLATSAKAQYYASDDTITEYPNKGTYYHDKFEGRKTASGEVFDQNKFTAAHWRIKLGTYVMVTNQNTGLQVIVKVNDRCPRRGVFDMSHRAAAAIGIRGMQPVTVRVLPDSYKKYWEKQELIFDSVRTRLHNDNSISITDLPQFPISSTNANSYNLMLGVAASDSEAFTQINQLPTSYRDHVSVETLEGCDSLRLTLDTRCTKKQAEHLMRTLKKSFPKVQILPAE